MRKFFLSFVVFAAICAAGLYWFVNHEVERAFNQAVSDVPGLIVSYDDIAVRFSDQSVILEGVEAALPGGQRVSAEEIRFGAFDQKNPVPHFAKVWVRGLLVHVTPANFGSWAAPLLSMGVREIRGDLAVDYAYDLTAQALTVRAFSLSAPQLGEVSLTGTVDRLDLDRPRVEKLVGLRLVAANLIYEDRALVGMALGSSARLLGISPAEARERLLAEIGSMIRYGAREGNAVAEDALMGLAEFVAEPGRVVVSARPDEPVPLLYFFMGRDLFDNLRLLNVSVTTDYERDI
ncbi:hypothetical protein GKC30_06230 [Pseudodesulfovibrio sp. F-1]|uniref:DUF945 family protein n=1 Tax=Pseudodesulfovibrio alkaliphilus TaxID=2661613 RepID=A0A7K1KMI3_9BACT|nr:hypothetical protein [Pseudodesulfovibrio alkaliphilus]MUM77227.1 hypothetical protein [Pseudodesulfovibrio alkaliphilus]